MEMRVKCGGGDTSTDGIYKTVHFSLNVDDLQIDTKDFLSHNKDFVSPPAYLLAVKNLVYQQLADVLSMPHSSTGCQTNSMW